MERIVGVKDALMRIGRSFGLAPREQTGKETIRVAVLPYLPGESRPPETIRELAEQYERTGCNHGR